MSLLKLDSSGVIQEEVEFKLTKEETQSILNVVKEKTKRCSNISNIISVSINISGLKTGNIRYWVSGKK